MTCLIDRALSIIAQRVELDKEFRTLWGSGHRTRHCLKWTSLC